MSLTLSAANRYDERPMEQDTTDLQLSPKTKRTIGKWLLGTSSFAVTVISGIAIGAALLMSPLGFSVAVGVGAVALTIGAIGTALILENSNHPAFDILGSFSIGFLTGSLTTGALAIATTALIISALGHMRF